MPMPNEHIALQYDPSSFLKNAITVAHHYGFAPAEHIIKQARREHRLPPRQRRGNYLSSQRAELNPPTCEFHAAMGMYVVENLSAFPQPVMFYHSNVTDTALGREVIAHRSAGKQRPIRFGVQVMGSPHSIAEALVLKIALDTLDELGVRETRVHINGIGDRDAVHRFTKELHWFFRRHIGEFTPDEQQSIKNDPLQAYRKLHRAAHPLCAEIPTSLEFLSEQSRRHLWEVLEYFEQAGIEYEIDPALVAPRHYTDTLFEIRHKEDDTERSCTALAVGGRYNELGQHFGKHHIPAAGIVIECAPPRSGAVSAAPSCRTKHPRLYLAHLGFEAKVKSLAVLDILRRARVPAYQSLGATTFSAQIETAESLKTPYLLILGYKEAVEGTVIIRDMHTRAQEVVPVEMLQTYLKQLSLKK